MPRPFKYLLAMAGLVILSIPFGLDPSASFDAFTDVFLKTLLVFLLMINVVTSFRRLRLMMEVTVLSACLRRPDQPLRLPPGQESGGRVPGDRCGWRHLWKPKRPRAGHECAPSPRDRPGSQPPESLHQAAVWRLRRAVGGDQRGDVLACRLPDHGQSPAASSWSSSADDTRRRGLSGRWPAAALVASSPGRIFTIFAGVGRERYRRPRVPPPAGSSSRAASKWRGPIPSAGCSGSA